MTVPAKINPRPVYEPIFQALLTERGEAIRAAETAASEATLATVAAMGGPS